MPDKCDEFDFTHRSNVVRLPSGNHVLEEEAETLAVAATKAMINEKSGDYLAILNAVRRAFGAPEK